MKCILCESEKLSKEFPRDPVSDECEHPASCCFRCMICYIGEGDVEQKSCPYKKYNGCMNEMAEGKKIREQYQTEIDQLYPPIEALDSRQDDLQVDIDDGDAVINVVTLAGDKASFPYKPQMTIEILKQDIFKKLGVQVDKQQLMYKDVALEELVDQKQKTLADYKVEQYATIHLMILMYAIPQNFNHVIFDLFWGYPARGRDYLDASCLAFSGKSIVSTVDFGHRSSTGIWHSGDVMDDSKRIGHHTIEVKLKSIPSNITHLYFTLSAWNSTSIAAYRDPSLKFFEATNKQKDLCKTTFTQAKNSQAVIMCSVSRPSGGQWKIFESGKLSSGNAMNYNPLVNTIKSL